MNINELYVVDDWDNREEEQPETTGSRMRMFLWVDYYLLGPYLDQYCYPRLLSLSSLDALLAWHPSPIGESG